MMTREHCINLALTYLGTDTPELRTVADELLQMRGTGRQDFDLSDARMLAHDISARAQIGGGR